MDNNFKFEHDYKDVNYCQRCEKVCNNDLCADCEKWLSEYMEKFNNEKMEV